MMDLRAQFDFYTDFGLENKSYCDGNTRQSINKATILCTEAAAFNVEGLKSNDLVLERQRAAKQPNLSQSCSHHTSIIFQ